MDCTSSSGLCGRDIRLKRQVWEQRFEIREKSANIERWAGAHGRQELPCNSRVSMSPIGSYVGGLTSKGQVGMLLGEHRGWILRMAALIKGRLSDNRPEAFAASFQTSEGEHQHAFLFPNIQHSTFHHSLKRMVPLSLQRGKRAAWFPFGEELAFSRFSTFSSSVCFPLL